MCWFCVVILSATLQNDEASGDPPSGEEVLSKIARYDGLFKTGFTVIARHQMMERVDGPGPFYRVDSRWKLTSQGSRIGYDMEIVDYEVPKYLAVDERPWGAEEVSGSAAGLAKQKAMLVVVRAREWGHWGADLSGTLREDRTVEVQPNGEATERYTIHNSSLYAAEAVQPVASSTSFKLGLGRFFSDFLDRIDSVKRLKNGRLSLSAIGRMPGCVGKWELEVEPESGWMVRRAKFFEPHAPQTISTEVVTEGTVWSGPFCIPETAKVNVFAGIEDMETVPSTCTRYLSFEPVVEKFDEGFYNECQQIVLHSDQEQLLVTDFRTSPPTYSKPNLAEAAPVPVADFKPKSLRHWFIILNVVIAVIVLGLGLRHRRRNAQS